MSSAPNAVARFSEQAPHFSGFRDVGLDRNGLAAAPANRAHDFLRGLLAADVVDDDSGAVGCKPLGNRAADAARAAGDDGDLA